MKKPPKFARGLSKKQIAAQLEEAVANAEVRLRHYNPLYLEMELQLKLRIVKKTYQIQRMEAGVPATHPEENSTLAGPASEEETPSLSNETLQNDPPSEVRSVGMIAGNVLKYNISKLSRKQKRDF